MKKLLAIMLALMLLTASAALAETGTTLTLIHPVINVNADGQATDIDMSDLTAQMIVGMVGETPTIQVNAANAEGTLLDAVIQMNGNTALYSIEGVSRPMSADLSESFSTLPVSLEEGLKSAIESLPELANTDLPTFAGVNIPKIDLMSLGQMVGATGDGQSATFEVPYETVSMLLSQVTQLKAMVPESAQPITGQLFDVIDQMVASNSGFALKGAITDDGATSELDVDVYPVSEGVTAEEPAICVVLTSTHNQINLTVSLVQGEDKMAIAEMVMTSAPESQKLDGSLNLMGGMLALTGSLYTEDGVTIMDVEMNAQGQQLTMTANYGTRDGKEVAGFDIGVADLMAASFAVEGVSEADGSGSGTIRMSGNNASQGMDFSFACDFIQTIGEVELRAIDNAADAVDVNDVQNDEALSAELQNALSGLMLYASSFAPAA